MYLNILVLIYYGDEIVFIFIIMLYVDDKIFVPWKH